MSFSEVAGMVGMTTHIPRHMYGTLLGGYKDVMVQEFAAMSSNHSRDTQQRTYVNPDLNTLKKVSADLLYSQTVLPTASGSGVGKRQPVLTDRAEKRIQEGIAATSANRLESYLKVSRKSMRSAQSYSESPRVQPKPFGFDLIKAPLP